ncbi:multisubunit sodium/proton antiporter MrpD subunit [Orenia metallireducens]|uniref:Multisubunit sodium/proton antiporter, MrpD subunit n=1 Tax=Orenia metallireducens TaxID=1413210 RepID=A0A285GSP9_9FIRM|nr:proton-conducting transporter membrane subunit [Orenia metallireducens]PRX32630.1 multisubunit sodium/proton antiporter MrpD subunit [Orenia metallireducens]SNY26582.1 multisubunit sodium/proton antiporter, MrpD subunit [Orenia metallireducens]
MITPGFLYLAGALFLFLAINNKIKYIISFLITTGALIITFYLTPGYSLEINFLNYTLIPFRVDDISKLTGLIFTLSGLAAVFYSINISSRSNLQLIFLFIGSSLTVVFTGDLFILYIFWELMEISSSFLIITVSDLTKKTGYYFFLMQAVGGLSLLWGVFLNHSATGSLSLNAIEAGIPFFMIAVGIKLAFIGLHTWMPQTYSKVPFYVTVVLSIYTTKVGVYVMYRLLSGINILAYAGLISALFGIVMALRQNQVRKLLSYSIITQVGYMIIGISIGSAAGITGAFFHLINHILYKTVLFMVAGVVIYTTGKENLEDLGILGSKLPITSLATLVAFMAISGVPFFNGYMSKTIIKEALQEPVLIWGLNLMSFGTSLMFLKFIYYAFFQNSNINLNRKPTISMQLGLGFLTIIMLLIGINPFLLENLTNIDVDINYFDIKLMLSGIQPFLWSVIVFILLKKYLVKEYRRFIYYDIYREMAKIFVKIGYKLSIYHNGKLSKYLLWATTTLIILLSLLI